MVANDTSERVIRDALGFADDSEWIATAGADAIAAESLRLIRKAEREFDALCAAGDISDAAIRELCGFAWRAAWISARRAALARGLPCDSVYEGGRVAAAIDRSNGAKISLDPFNPSANYFELDGAYRYARGFLQRTLGEPDEMAGYMLENEWMIRRGFANVRKLINAFFVTEDVEAVA